MRKFVFLDGSNTVKNVVLTTDEEWKNTDATMKDFTLMEVELGTPVALGSTYDGEKFSPLPAPPEPITGRDALAELDDLKAKLTAAGIAV